MNRLARYGAEALKPQKVSSHKWHAPLVSRRIAKVLRKKAMRNGSYGTVVIDPDSGKAVGGWDPTWDIFEAPAPRPMRPQRLHKNQKNREKRAANLPQEVAVPLKFRLTVAAYKRSNQAVESSSPCMITAKLEEQEQRLKDLNRVRAIPKPKPGGGVWELLTWLETGGRPKEQN